MQVKKSRILLFYRSHTSHCEGDFLLFSRAIKFKMELITNIRFLILVLSFAKTQNQCATEIERELNYNQTFVTVPISLLRELRGVVVKIFEQNLYVHFGGLTTREATSNLLRSYSEVVHVRVAFIIQWNRKSKAPSVAIQTNFILRSSCKERGKSGQIDQHRIFLET